ncbi:hypothetical protein BV372_33885, partial [Nostoc sp. T09]|uniref:Tll0287-like domain-containing protein n=1 Tax=Nostoc sp. T09 TaxID=1932621 RepID=UPI000B66AAE4
RFEAKLIERFESDRTLKTLSNFRLQAGEKLFYSTQPLTVIDSRCLLCHGKPDQTLKSHVQRYCTQNGYRWKLNQVVGTQKHTLHLTMHRPAMRRRGASCRRHRIGLLY